jgi:hypothetical protein
VLATLHRGAKAAFLLDELTEDVNVDFSVRQGDPLAILLFIINMEPYLFTLAHRLAGLLVGLVREVVEGYVEDVKPVGENDSDILLIDSLTRKFEAMSGQILNRNRKTAILGLGTWAGRQDWPLGWLNSPSNLKIFGVTFGPSLSATMTASWEAVSKGVMAAINMWSGRRLPTLRLKRDVIETYAFSKLWYMCQILPLPSQVAQRLTSAAGSFLWRSHLERLAWQELHSPLTDGGLAVSDLNSRAQALLAKQFCWQAGNGGHAAGHWAYWLGSRLAGLLPQLIPGPHAPTVPPAWLGLAEVLKEVFSFNTVQPANLLEATAKGSTRSSWPLLLPQKLWPSFRTFHGPSYGVGYGSHAAT